MSARLRSAPPLPASGQDGLAQAAAGFFVEGGNDFGQRLRTALALLHKPECAPGQFRGTDTEGGPSRPPGTVWPGRLGLEKGGSAPAPHVHLADPGRVLLGSAGRAQVPGERRLPGNLPAPREAPRAPGERCCWGCHSRRPGGDGPAQHLLPPEGPGPSAPGEARAGETAVEV